jgi:hypothetical protein
MVSSSSECEVTRDPSFFAKCNSSGGVEQVVRISNRATAHRYPATIFPHFESVERGNHWQPARSGKTPRRLAPPLSVRLGASHFTLPHLQPCLAPPSRLPAQLIYKLHLLVKLSLMLSYLAVVMLDVPHLPWK